MVAFSASATAVTATQMDMKVRQFEFKVDEPASLGGQDTGPNPVELVLAGIIGCMTIMIQKVAHERGVTLTHVATSATGELNPMKFLGRPTDERAGFSAIEVTLDVAGDVAQTVLDDICTEAEARCPVSDNLAHIVPLSITARVAQPAVA